MTDQMELPPAACVVTHEVKDFAEWKVGFDNHEDARRSAGALGHHLNRFRDNPNMLSIYLAITDVDRAKAFAESDDLRETMEKVGVISAPVIQWMEPVREQIVWDRELPAFIISHRVADFDAWLAGYDAADTIQKESGIIGHAANRSLDDRSMAVVYHQAESFETLESFLAMPELKALMEEAGVISEPDVQFVTGGWAKMY